MFSSPRSPDTSTSPSASSSSAPSSPAGNRGGLRARWAAIGAAVAVSLGAGGGFGLAQAVQDSGERSTYTPITTCRLMDTRPGSDNVGPRDTKINGGETVTVDARGAQGNCAAEDLPSDATALQLNVTTIGATTQSFLALWPDGARPTGSSLNPSPGAPPTPNAVTTKLSSAGTFELYNHNGATNVFIDVVGYYTDHNHDDRYFTKAEVQALDDNLLDVISAPGGGIKTNGEAIEILKDQVAAGAPLKNQVLVLDKLDFRPYNLDGTAFARISGAEGVYIPNGASNNQLFAPLDLPVGATITTMQATVIDTVGGTSLEVEFRVDGVGVGGTIQTSGSSANTQILGATINHTPVAGQSLVVRAQAFGNSDWKTETDGLQVVKVLLVYDEAGA